MKDIGSLKLKTDLSFLFRRFWCTDSHSCPLVNLDDIFADTLIADTVQNGIGAVLDTRLLPAVPILVGVPRLCAVVVEALTGKIRRAFAQLHAGAQTSLDQGRIFHSKTGLFALLRQLHALALPGQAFALVSQMLAEESIILIDTVLSGITLPFTGALCAGALFSITFGQTGTFIVIVAFPGLVHTLFVNAETFLGFIPARTICVI